MEFDRDTALNIALGGILGAKGYTFWTALGLSGVITGIELLMAHANPETARGGTVEQFAIDAATTLSAWAVGRIAFPHPRTLAATTSAP